MARNKRKKAARKKKVARTSGRQRYSLVATVGITNALVILSIVGTLMGYWYWLATPLLRADEQTKTELVAASYTRTVSDALESGDRKHLDSILGELLLLTEPDTERAMIHRVELVDLPSGETIVASGHEGTDGQQETSEVDSGLSTFAVEVPLFSKTSFEFLGTMRLHKAMALEDQSLIFRGAALLILILLLALQGLWWRQLRPLGALADNLQRVKPGDGRPLPRLTGYVAKEIQQVQDAVSDYVAGLEEARSHAEEQKELAERHAEDLARSNRDLEQFAYVASHDLKAPLRAIDNLSQWIAEDLDHVLVGDTREHMDLLRGRVNRLEHLLDDLLGYSRAGRVDVDVANVDTNDIFEGVLSLLDPPENFRMDVDGTLPKFRTAPGPLEQVLRNLIGNAIKHHDRSDGHIQLGVRDIGTHYEFWVADDGPGIAPEFRDRAFQMFQTLRPRDEVEGSGMGLAIVKKLVEWQGGTIVAEPSGMGNGTRFRFQWRKEWAPANQRVHNSGEAA